MAEGRPAGAGRRGTPRRWDSSCTGAPAGLPEPAAEVGYLIEDVKRRQAEDADWLRGAIPHPATYLNGERWQDEITKPTPTGRPAPNKQASEAWEQVIGAIRNGTDLPKDPRIRAVVSSMGGRSVIGMSTESKLPWLKRDFVAAFEAST